MLWKKGHRVLTAGTMKVRRDPRMKLVKTDLQISKVGVHDGGMYRCEIEQDDNRPLAVIHTVEILGMKDFILLCTILLTSRSFQLFALSLAQASALQSLAVN